MKREIIKIDEEKCNGCGLCIPNCHEGALQIIDGKARLISDLMCDGLGACIGHCPEGAMEIEVREAAPYDEVQVIEEMVKNGRNVVIAHMKHLKDHGEHVFLKQAVGYLMDNATGIDFPVKEVIQEVHFYNPGAKIPAEASAFNLQNSARAAHSNGSKHMTNSPADAKSIVMGQEKDKITHQHGGGCPGSRSISFAVPVNNINPTEVNTNSDNNSSQLTQWPVQMHLINPRSSHFANSDLLLAADCVAYSMGNFHNGFLKGKTLAIACPKLDSNKDIYLEKLIHLINEAKINTLTVMKMEVPCCSGIEHMAMQAVKSASRKVPVKSITVGVQGTILSEEWL